MVDDQRESYTVDIFGQTKANHEVWVSQKLCDTLKSKQLRFRRVKQNIPAYLTRLTTGKEVLNLLLHSCAFSMNQDEPKLVGSFL